MRLSDIRRGGERVGGVHDGVCPGAEQLTHLHATVSEAEFERQCSTWVSRRDKERNIDETHQVCDIAAQNVGRAVSVSSREVHDAQ